MADSSIGEIERKRKNAERARRYRGPCNRRKTNFSQPEFITREWARFVSA